MREKHKKFYMMFNKRFNVILFTVVNKIVTVE